MISAPGPVVPETAIAANATMMKLNGESLKAKQQPVVSSVGSARPAKVCFSCSGFGHISKECPTLRKRVATSKRHSNGYRVVCFKCHKVGHMARDCYGLIATPNKRLMQNRPFTSQSMERKP